MTDYFAILGEPRRPWIEAESLKEKFHALTATHHPDVSRDTTIDFTALNAAYTTLRDPRARLRHLLECEFPAEMHSHQIPPALADLFMQTAALRQQLDVFLKKETGAASSLAGALMMPEKISMIETVQSHLSILDEEQTKLLDELRAVDAQWNVKKPAARLAEIYQALSFVAKWGDQLRDGLVKLSL